MWLCDDVNKNQQWKYIDMIFRARHNENFVLDAHGTTSNSPVGQWQFNGGANQEWMYGNTTNAGGAPDTRPPEH